MQEKPKGIITLYGIYYVKNEYGSRGEISRIIIYPEPEASTGQIDVLSIIMLGYSYKQMVNVQKRPIRYYIHR